MNIGILKKNTANPYQPKNVLDENVKLLWYRKSFKFYQAVSKSLEYVYNSRYALKDTEREKQIEAVYNVLVYCDLYALQKPFDYKKVRYCSAHLRYLENNIRKYSEVVIEIQTLVNEIQQYRVKPTSFYASITYQKRLERLVELKVQYLNEIMARCDALVKSIEPIRSNYDANDYIS